MNHKINGCIKYLTNENTQKQEEVICLYPEQIEQDEYIPIKQTDIICEFIIKDKLGEGAFGAVHLGINKQTEENVAIKILEKSRINKYKGKVRLEREIEILKKLKHPNIVQFYCVIETQMKIFLIEEYIKGKELFQYIVLKKKLSEEEACFYFQQIISGIEYLQKLKIAHRDIKSENILIEQYTNNIKIIDFGLSNSFDDKNGLLNTACGSPCYAAPEMLDGKMYHGSTVDIWSVGVVLFSMICGYLPFHEESNKEMYKKIKDGKYTIPSHVSKLGRELIHSLLNTNPKKRIKIQQIKKHSWIKFYSNGLNNDGKSIFNTGLLTDKYVVPIDEEIVEEMEKSFKISKIKIRTELLYNKSNDYTSLYYLMLNKKIKSGRKSIADLKSELFISYIENKKNLLSNYNNDIENVVKERKMGVILEEGNLENDKEKSMFDSQVKYNLQSYDNIYKINSTINKENETIKGSSYNSIFKEKLNNKNIKIKNNKLNIEFKKNINTDKNELHSTTPKSTKNNNDIKLRTIFKNNNNSRTIPQNIETYQKRKFKNLQSYLKTANLSPIIEKKNLTINLKHKKNEKNKKINMTVGSEKFKGKEVKKRNVLKFLKIKTYSHDDLEEEKNTEKKKEIIINDTEKNIKIINNKESINIINDGNLKEEKNKGENITNIDNKYNNNQNNEINILKETITLENSDKKNNENTFIIAPSLEVEEINKILDNKTYNHKIIESIFVQTINQEKNEIITSTNSPRDIKSIDLNTLPIKKEVNRESKYLSSCKKTKKKDKRFKLLKHISKCDSKSENKVKNYKFNLNKAIKSEISENINENNYNKGSKTQRNWNSKKDSIIQKSLKNKTNLTQTKPKKDIKDKNKSTTRENYLRNIESYNSKRTTHKFNSFIEKDIINKLNLKDNENDNINKDKIESNYGIKVSKNNTKKMNSSQKDKFSINFNNSNTISGNKDIKSNKNNVKRFNTCKNNLKNNNFKFKLNNKLFISKVNSKKLKDRNIIKNLAQNKSTKNECKSNFNHNNYLVYNKLLKSEVNNSMNENEIKNNFSVYNERINKNIISNNNIKNNLNKQEIDNIINEEKQELQDFEPFDLSCIFNLSQKLVKEKILNNLEKIKYRVKQINSYKYNIINRENKNIYELSIPPNYLNIIKFKKIKAMNNNYVTDIRQIINQLN